MTEARFVDLGDGLTLDRWKARPLIAVIINRWAVDHADEAEELQRRKPGARVRRVGGAVEVFAPGDDDHAEIVLGAFAWDELRA